MVKKGDTLVEVILAIGIFSMVAIAVASVMSGGTSGAQLSLETTLAREEIDTQADALRYIQSTATANKENKDAPLSALWQTITKGAIDNLKNLNKNEIEGILSYSPSSCSEMYSTSTPGRNNAFIINPRALSSSNVQNAYVKINNKFTEASTYPRLVYGTNNTLNDDNSDFSENKWYTDLFRVEGIYVIAVRDPGSTTVVNIDGKAENSQAYYDFYIRTCWYGAGNTEPSTISTVVRLHDPDSVSSALGNIIISVDGVGLSADLRNPHTRRSLRLPEVTSQSITSHYGWVFNGWKDVNTGEIYEPGALVFNTDPSVTPTYRFVEDWTHTEYKITYDSNGSTWSTPTTTCYQDTGCAISTDTPTRSGYEFKGWCKGIINGTSCDGTMYQPGNKWTARNSETDRIPEVFTPNRTLALKAVWAERNESITIKLTWSSSPRDLDAHITGTKADGSFFHTYYSNKTYSEGRVIASLDQDVTSGYGPETITLNTLGGRNYYYYVYCFSDCTKITNATVVVSGPYLGTKTYYSNNASGTGRYWNVFAYKDGKIVEKQTHSSSPQTSY